MALRFLWFMTLAFALVATVTFAGPAGEDDTAAMAAEKEYVTDPSTGKQVVKPEYGGHSPRYSGEERPITATRGSPTAPGWRRQQALDRLGRADWAADRSVYPFTTYFPESILRGHLAESWENPDPLTYIYKIRDNVFFHDKPPVNGRQLTADDMAANYERMLSIGRFAGQERSPVGHGTVLLPIESVAATDELTLMIKLSRPFRDTHRLLFDDPHIFARPPETFDTLDDANNVIGTGPFIMDEFVSGISVTFDRNPNYWKDDEKFPGNRLPYVDRLVMLVMGDQATRLAALRSAQVDLSGWNGAAQITSISSVLELQKTNPDMQFFPDRVPIRGIVAHEHLCRGAAQRRAGTPRVADGDRPGDPQRQLLLGFRRVAADGAYRANVGRLSQRLRYLARGAQEVLLLRP